MYQKMANNCCDAGAWNCLIFFRPKYLQTRRKYRDQTRIWAARRCIFGEEVRRSEQNKNSRLSQGSMAQSRIGTAGELFSRAESTNVIPETAQDSLAQTGINMAGEVFPHPSSALSGSTPESTLETRVSG